MFVRDKKLPPSAWSQRPHSAAALKLETSIAVVAILDLGSELDVEMEVHVVRLHNDCSSTRLYAMK